MSALIYSSEKQTRIAGPFRQVDREILNARNYNYLIMCMEYFQWSEWCEDIRSITFWFGRARSEENQLAQINSFLDIQRIMLWCWALQVTALTTLPMIWKGVPSADPQGVLLYSLGVVSNDQSDPIYSHVWVCPDLRGVLLSMCVAKVAKSGVPRRAVCHKLAASQIGGEG